MSKPNFKLFEVAGEYIVAQTAEEALQDHLNRIGNWQEWYKYDELPEPTEVSLDETALFEQEKGGYKEMTYWEFIGEDYVYNGPELICWKE